MTAPGDRPGPGGPPPLNRHPFFRPLWLRLAVVALCLGWAIFEMAAGSEIWAALVAGLGVYAAAQLLVFWKGAEPEPGAAVDPDRQSSGGGDDAGSDRQP